MKMRYLLAGLAGSTAIAAGAISAVSAAGNGNTNGNVGSSNIPRSVFDQDRLNAVASVLNTTTSNVTSARHNHTLDQLIKNAGLSRQTFEQKVKAQLNSELATQGYSQDQITIAEQHRNILHLRHELKHDKAHDKNS